MPGISAGMAALISALIGAGTTGTITGLEASGAIGGGGSSGPSPQQLQLQQQEAAQKQQQTQEQEAFKNFAPNAVAQTGGALDPASLAAMTSELSGSPADVGLAFQTLFPNQPGTASGAGGLSS